MHRKSSAPLAFVPPMLPTLVAEPPDGGEWIHEIKYDGWRMQIVVEGGKARVFTRNGHDWTSKFRPIAEAAECLPVKTAIIDGETIVSGADGKPDFQALRAAIRDEPGRLVFVAFDLLLMDDRDLRALTLMDRKKALWSLVEPGEGRIQYSRHVDVEGSDFFSAVDEMGLEGIVSKRQIAGTAAAGRGPGSRRRATRRRPRHLWRAA